MWKISQVLIRYRQNRRTIFVRFGTFFTHVSTPRTRTRTRTTRTTKLLLGPLSVAHGQKIVTLTFHECYGSSPSVRNIFIWSISHFGQFNFLLCSTEKAFLQRSIRVFDRMHTYFVAAVLKKNNLLLLLLFEVCLLWLFERLKNCMDSGWDNFFVISNHALK